MAKKKRPEWFKSHLFWREMIDSYSDAQVGRAFKDAMIYFADGVLPEQNDELQKVLFKLFKISIDEAVADYIASVNNGKEGADIRWGNRPPING